MALAKTYQNCNMERLNELVSKHPKQYADLLKLLVPIIIEYYGTEFEEVIYGTLSNLAIEEVSSQYPKLSSLHSKFEPDNLSSIDNGIDDVDDKTLDRAVGEYGSYPIISEGKSGYELDGEINFLAFKPFQNSSYGLSLFVHELLHAIKSSREQYRIVTDENNQQYLQDRCGLIYMLYELHTREDGTIESTIVIKKKTGIEEEINTFDEVSIMNILLAIPLEQIPEELRYILEGKEHRPDPSGYKYLHDRAKELLSDKKIASLIRNVQLNGTGYIHLQEEFNKTIGSKTNAWQELTHNMDSVVSDVYEAFGFLGDAERIEKIIERMKEPKRKIQGIIKQLDQRKEKPGEKTSYEKE